jgi:hypothetical protein
MDEVLHLALLPHPDKHPADQPEPQDTSGARAPRVIPADLR